MHSSNVSWSHTPLPPPPPKPLQRHVVSSSSVRVYQQYPAGSEMEAGWRYAGQCGCASTSREIAGCGRLLPPSSSLFFMASVLQGVDCSRTAGRGPLRDRSDSFSSCLITGLLARTLVRSCALSRETNNTEKTHQKTKRHSRRRTVERRRRQCGLLYEPEDDLARGRVRLHPLVRGLHVFEGHLRVDDGLDCAVHE